MGTPGGTYLPVFRTPRLTIYLTDDGRMRLYHTREPQLLLDNDGEISALDSAQATTFVATALDRLLGLSAAMDQDGKLYVYQQHISVGTFDLGLSLQVDLRPSIAISRGGGAIFVTDGQRIALTDSSGQVRKKIDTHYLVRRLTCSPDGQYVATCDMESGVVRVYRGEDLSLFYQRFAIDLVAKAAQVQLMADLPPLSAALNTLVMNNDGVLAFSMSGVVCVTDLAHMDRLPRQQSLL